MKTSDLGMSTQKLICEIYEIVPNDIARAHFDSEYSEEYKFKITPLLTRLFNDIGAYPIELTTFKKIKIKDRNVDTPYNFILSNQKTLSIRTSKIKDKVCPRIVGQAGLDTFNSFFNDIIPSKVKNKEDIREAIFNNIHLMLPIFIDYLLNADITVWIYSEENEYKYQILNESFILNLEFDRENFTFTRDLENWIESTTLKYKDISIAEIQTHQNRTFKFRFQMRNLLKFLLKNKETTETLGITAEKTICDIFQIDYPENFEKRYSLTVQNQISNLLIEAFKDIPKPIKHTGSEKGDRAGASKSSFDFLLEGKKTLSVKTNSGSYVCPPEVGQPSDKTFFSYFGHLTNEDHIDELIFKNLVLSKINDLLPIYIKHLFDSDILLWIKLNKSNKRFKIIRKEDIPNFSWDQSKINFTCKTIEDWNECNTLKYGSITIGQFQFHRNRNCYKFRFHLENLLKLLVNDD